jgi:hypothetical protein
MSGVTFRDAIPGDVFRSVALGVGSIGGDHRASQVHAAEQVADLGDLVGIVRDAMLGDDQAVAVQHRGEQLDLPVCDAAQPLAIDPYRRQGLLKAACGGDGGQPAAAEQVQPGRVQGLQQRADPLLAGAMVCLRSGYSLLPSRASTSCGRSAA